MHRVAAPLGPDEKVTALRQVVQAGGPAANAAITFAALGGQARLITALGRHPLAVAAADDLAACGVDVVDATSESDATPPVSAVRVVDATGQRSVSSVNDASGSDATLASIEVDELLVLDGWYPGLAMPAARTAHESGVPIVLGAGSWRPLVADLLPWADYVIVPAQFPIERIPREAICARTSGAGPIEWQTSHASGAVTVPRVDVRDTLAAGDVFLGAAAHALAAGHTSWPDVLGRAASVAARFVSAAGSRASRLSAVQRGSTPISRPTAR